MFCVLPLLGFAQNILLYNDGAMVKVQAGAVLYVQGGIQNTATGTIDNDGTIELEGNFVNAGTWEPSQVNTLRFSGTGNSDVTSGSAVFQNIEVTKVGGNVNLMDNMTISTTLPTPTLNFNSAGATKIVTGNFDLKLGNTTTIVGYDSDEFVATSGTGYVQKDVTANGTFEFPIGETTNYTPITSIYTGTAYASANIKARVIDATHPNKPSDAESFISRYWKVNQTGITNYSDSLTATFIPADLNGTTALIKGATYDGANWAYTNANNGANIVKGRTGVTNADFTGTNFFGRVDLKLFLAGAMPASNTPPMTTSLNNAPSLIPLGSPYSVSPWNAPALTATSIPANTTDWILIESRDPSINIVSQTSAFLKNDGTVVGVDGGPLRLKDALQNSIISVRHRNHLGIRTINAINLTASPVTFWDFSTGTGQAYTNPAITTNANMRLMGTTYCLWSGNANIALTSNGLTKVTYIGLQNDPAAILTALSGNSGSSLLEIYHQCDLNLNRKVSFIGLANDPQQILNSLGGNSGAIVNQHL